MQMIQDRFSKSEREVRLHKEEIERARKQELLKQERRARKEKEQQE